MHMGSVCVCACVCFGEAGKGIHHRQASIDVNVRVTQDQSHCDAPKSTHYN